jgi:hypothetical protein
MMFQSTLPLEAADLMRVSDFRRYLASLQPDTEAGGLHSRVSQLNPSLLQDLQRFERASVVTEGLEVLEVMAAAVRHNKRLLLHLQHERVVLPLTVFPAEHLVHCPLPMAQLMASRLNDLRVLQVEPALLRPPADTASGLAAPADRVAPLGPVLWELALRGSREALLPEIAGNAAYRIAPGVDLRGLDLSGSLAAAVHKLRRQTTNLRDIANWPGFDMARATRLLNGLYLQAGLMVSRTHPAATNEGWTGNA